ncbi:MULTISPECIES: LuxR C-terminal-related transcriptional regulator [Kitasatospora]|uniref:Putative LuxR family transcriptional regulator n=1 Tax=Kitasatospora setae (strain ATCC 33774 / DSM 43861 / JCM 3304 / KCC A-0304 / NBRC 14216 / KM-6054) TaxID=452652 RepID=E4MZ46_KITSK|nr:MULTISPECIES: LuxR C-terminal-related transcriptional regulator [Kitasatospora]BAJ29620.1 putative LuxR family transcriptional regulator [Kitasatospora setae KM-6054]
MAEPAPTDRSAPAAPTVTTAPAPAAAPTAAEKALYLAVLRAGGRVSVREAAEQDAAATARLLALGLLVHHDESEQLTAVNPRTAGGRLSRELREAGTRLFEAAEHVPAGLDALADAYDSAPRPGDGRRQITHLLDVDRIRHRLLQIEADFREEVLAAQPGCRPGIYLEKSARTEKALAGGARMDILYQPVVKSDPAVVDYAVRATGWGMRLRSLDEDFTRMLIFDRRVAILSASADNRTAAFVEDPAVVDHLVRLFQRDWERAERVPWHDLAGAGVPPTAEQIGRLLATGLTQKAIATRLALSERTVAEHIARLRERYDAATLFQLGWLMREADR